jgi:putative ABC transport system permease protein
MLKAPGFTLIAVIALALGIGANTAIFSVVQSILLRPLPYKQPDQLAIIWTSLDKIGLPKNFVSEPEVLDFREQSKLFESFGVIADDTASLTGDGEPEQIQQGQVSSNFFSLLGASPALGRDFLPEEEKPGAPGVVMLSHSLWQSRFGGDSSIIGRKILLDNAPFTVVGVMGADFSLALPKESRIPANLDLWTPYAVDYKAQDRQSHGLILLGRLNAGVSISQAQSEMDSIAANLYPLYYTDTGFGVKVIPLHEDIVKQIRPALLILLGAVGFVLLIACANVANLLLARSAARQKEITIRAALGARRLHIIRQLLTESLLLALLGSVFGLILAVWGIDALLKLSPDSLPRIEKVGVDFQVFLFTLAVAALTGIVVGLAPALQFSKPDLSQAMKDVVRDAGGGIRGRRLRSAFVVAEIALCLMLLVGAGLMIRSFINLQRVDPGFKADNVLAVKLQLPQTKYRDGAQVSAFYQQLLERVRALPGVEAAATTSHLPLSNENWSGTYTFKDVTANAERDSMASFEADNRIITSDYFRVMGASLVSGRLFNEQDAAGRPMVVIIDDKLARRCWPGEDAVGKKMAFGRFPDNPQWVEIVGVVKQIRHDQLSEESREQVYFSHLQRRRGLMNLAIRTTSDPSNLVGAVRSTVYSLDPDQPIYQIRTMSELVAKSLAPARFTLLLVIIFAGVAAALAVIGIYGVMSYASARRTQEIGIRMALGADQSDILKAVMGQGAVLILAGVGAGLAGAAALTRVLSGLLFGVSATDPVTFAVISLVLALAALLACYIPARRATRIDPQVALRYE